MAKTISVIDSYLALEGMIISNSQINLSGIINGTVFSERVVINGGGSINGNTLVSQSIFVENGSINGNISGYSIKLSKNAKIYGDIEYVTLMVEDGALILGTIKKIEENELKEKIKVKLEELKPKTSKNINVIENEI